MSSLMSQISTGARTRVPRFAEAAVERARLTVVPQRALGRTQAARTPFVVLVLGLLVAGVVGLLMFNTNMQQDSFTATKLQNQVTADIAKEQSLKMALDQLRDPQQLAVAAKKLGMVAPSEPAFIRIADGKVLGNPTPATSADSVRINSLPSAKPSSINPPPIIIKVPARNAPGSTTTGTSRTTSRSTGAASTSTTQGGGRKKAQSQSTHHSSNAATSGASH